MTAPAATGPMKGEWDPALLTELGRLRLLTARAMDAAQVGGPLDPAFVEQMESVLPKARAYGVSRRVGPSSLA